MGFVKRQKVLVTALFAPEGASSFGPQWKPGTELPKTLLVLRCGSNPSNKGTFEVNAATRAAWSRVMRERGRDRVTIDFEHNTLEGSPAYKQSTEPRAVAGRGIPVLTPAGVELHEIEWTADGRRMAEHYGDLSPAPWHTEDGTVIGLHSVGLVRNGAIYDLTFCSADAGMTETNPEEEEMKDLLAALSAAKLIPENGTEADVANLIVALNKRAADAEAALVLVSGLSADKIKELAGEIVTAQVTALTAQLDGLKQDHVRQQKEHLLELAKFEGKVVALTADVVASLSVDQLKEQIGKIKPTVPLSQRTPATGLGAGDGAGAPSEIQRQVATACGLDPAKVSW